MANSTGGADSSKAAWQETLAQLGKALKQPDPGLVSGDKPHLDELRRIFPHPPERKLLRLLEYMSDIAHCTRHIEGRSLQTADASHLWEDRRALITDLVDTVRFHVEQWREDGAK